MGTLKDLAVAENASEAFQAEGNLVAIQITTSESSAIEVHSCADGVNFDALDNVNYTINGTSTKNLADVVNGQYLKVVATSGTLTAVKLLDNE